MYKILDKLYTFLMSELGKKKRKYIACNFLVKTHMRREWVSPLPLTGLGNVTDDLRRGILGYIKVFDFVLYANILLSCKLRPTPRIVN